VRARMPPKRTLRPALPFGDWRECQQDSAVGKIGADDDILDPVENNGAGEGKKNFVLIGEQPTRGKGTATRQPAEGIRQPRRQATEIVEGQGPAPWPRPRPAPRPFHWTGVWVASVSSTSKLTAPDFERFALTPCPMASLASSGIKALSSVLARSWSRKALRVMRFRDARHLRTLPKDQVTKKCIAIVVIVEQ
jgi:hypothetical protein